MDLDLNKTFDSIKDGISQTAQFAHEKTNEIHDKYISKIIPDFGKYGDAAKFVAEMAPGVSEYNAIKDGDWVAFAIAAGVDIAAIAIGAYTAGAGYAAVKGGTSVAKTGVKVAAKEVAEAGAKKVVKEIVEEGTEKLAKEAVEVSVEKVVKETVETGVEKVTKETIENATVKVAQEATEKTAKEIAEAGTEKVAKEAVEAGSEKGLKELADEGIEHIVYHTDEIQRINNTPKSGFDGIRGNSKCYPDGNTEAGRKAIDKMAEYGQDSVKYENGIVDFSPFSETTVRIDMTDNRKINFKNADEACSKKWNDALIDGRNNWTASDIKEWRHENNFTWHERSDMKRCDLVSLDIHNSEVFSHTGGIAEFNAKNKFEIGGLFDE